MDRRTVLATLVGGAALGLAGCTGGGGPATTTDSETTTDTATPEPTPTATPTPGSPYGDWFANTDNYDGTVDRTGQDEVRVTVGAEGNGGAFAYDPAAVQVSTGTTVVWEWTGEGGQHNVLANDGEFESDLVADAGHTFRYRFDQPGTFLYVCVPHKSLGMRGAVRVAES